MLAKFRIDPTLLPYELDDQYVDGIRLKVCSRLCTWLILKKRVRLWLKSE
jgi:hypothetical protein